MGVVALKPPGGLDPSQPATFTGAPVVIQNASPGVNSLVVRSNGGAGMLDRFTIENNAVEPVDVDLTRCVLNLGETVAGTPGVSAVFSSPAAAVYSPIQVRQPGSAVNNVLLISQAGAITQNVGGLAGTARVIGVIGEANPRYREDEFGAQSWGAGGAAAVDVTLARSAAATLRCDGRVIAAGGLDTRVVLTAALPAGAAAMDGHILIEDGGAGVGNLIIYKGGQRFRIAGGAPF